MNKQNSHFVRRLIISYSALLIVILVMGAYLYNISIENVSNEIRTQTKLSLEKSVNDMDTAFKTMEVLAGQTAAMSEIGHMAAMENTEDPDFFFKAFTAKEDLSVLSFTESVLPIKSSYIHLRNTNYTLSYTEFIETDIHYLGRSYYRDLYDQWLLMLHDETNYRQFIPVDSFKAYSDSTFIYKLPLDEYTLKNVPATLCFEIDFSKLRAIYSDLNLYETGSIIAVDGEGNVVYVISDGNPVPVTLADIENNESMSITRADSQFNDWHYYLVQPSGAALYSLTQYRNIFIIIILIGVLLEIMLILFLSRSNVKKITQLGNELQNTITLHEDLQKAVDTQKPIIKQSYLRKIIKGNIATEKELDYARQYLNINTEDKKFSVLYLTAYMHHYEYHIEDSAVTGPEDINYNEIIQQNLQQFFGDDVFFFSPRAGEYAILLSSDTDEAPGNSTDDVRTTFELLHNSLKNNYSIWTLGGIGNWHEGLMITWKSYQQAAEAISYATKRDTFKCYANIDRDTAGFYYPVELTNQLTSFVTSGNDNQVLEIFEIIRHENMEERSLPIQVMKYLLSDVRNTLYKIRFTAKETPDNKDVLSAIDGLFEQPMSLKLCEDIAVNLCQLFDANSSNNALIQTIRTYIDDNYKDPSMSLTKISDEFSISESYFSYLFKEEIGENFSSYLAHTRIEQAYKLIKETDINVSEIYNEVGYNNSHSFRRVFKRIYGMTPKEVRSLLRND